MPPVINRQKSTIAIRSNINLLYILAFDKSLTANIILSDNGKIVLANHAACRLLGYSRRELLTLDRTNIFDTYEAGFIKMLKEKKSKGQSRALVTAIKKSSQRITCEITSVIFADNSNLKKEVITLVDMTSIIQEQKIIDARNNKTVANNIGIAISKQKSIDIKNNKVVTDNINLAISKQKTIDARNNKTVANNIGIAISKQKNIDIKNNKVVTDNINLAISKQKTIDARNNKTVANNIGIAISKQKNIDIKNNKVVTDNINLAISKQKTIDARNNKTVADNIGIAISKQKNIDVKNKKVVTDNINLAISKQKIIDIRNTKTVADNVEIAIARQKNIDIQNNKVVADNINIAIAKQKEVDILNNKTVADNISIAILRQEEIDIQNNKIVADNISIAILKQEEIDIQNNKIVADNIAIAISKQKEIDIQNHKVVADNIILALVKSDARLAKNNDEHFKKFNLAAKLSSDGLWELDLLTNKFLLGEGFEEMFGYSSENSSGYIANWGNYLHPDDRKNVKKSLQHAIASTTENWEQGFRFIRADGTVVNVFGRASIARQPDGKAYRLIGVIHDLSCQKDLEEKLEYQMAANIKQSAEYKENYKLIFNSSSDVLYDFDLLSNEVVVSDGFEKEFGYPTIPHMSPTELWGTHIHPEDSEKLTADFIRMIASSDKEWKYSCRFLKADNTVANILGSSIVMRSKDGKAYRLIGSMQDISKQTVLEERLKKEILLKEKQIADATEDAKDTERSDIGKELHDNINQLLSASRLYLEMAKKGGNDSELYLSRSSEYTIKAIEEIRQLSKGLTTDIIRSLGLREAIGTISRDTMEVSRLKISCALESFIEKSVGNKFKLNLFRIVQEQLNNILKYAAATKVDIKLSLTKKSVTLTITDNGIGFDTVKKSKGIGIANIKSRAASYYGTADFVSQPGHGCFLKVIFPLTDALQNAA